MKQTVKLIGTTENPKEVTYLAFRNCYSAKPPEEVWGDIQSGKISSEEINTFVDEKLNTGHNSPLRLTNYVFIIDGVSRAMTAQFNRHVIGIGREEVSQRYVDFSKGLKNFVMPESFKDVEVLNRDSTGTILLENKWNCLMDEVKDFYESALSAGIPKEDARFALPMATVSREVVSFTFEALQHFIDIRTCNRAQWEIRGIAIKMMNEIKKHDPTLGAKLGCKCLANRIGFCDEDYNEYKKCSRSKIRPHKTDLMKLWKENKWN